MSVLCWFGVLYWLRGVLIWHGTRGMTWRPWHGVLPGWHGVESG